jgi:hypothetical protein
LISYQQGLSARIISKDYQQGLSARIISKDYHCKKMIDFFSLLNYGYFQGEIFPTT